VVILVRREVYTMNAASQIPRIIHQSWKNTAIPLKCAPLRQTWLRQHPRWEYRFWTDADNRKLIATYYPELLSMYDSYPLNINRAELARYMVMRRHGGVYVDLDFECLRPLDELVARGDLIFGLEPRTHAERAPVRRRGLDRIVCNAFMASVPDNPFWKHLTTWLLQSSGNPSLLDCTGVFLLTRACDSFPHPEAITILPPELMYPIGSECGALSDEQRRGFARISYAIHHWHGSWWREAALKATHDKISLARKT
jgi:hypothetical protein